MPEPVESRPYLSERDGEWEPDEMAEWWRNETGPSLNVPLLMLSIGMGVGSLMGFVFGLLVGHG